MFEFSSIEQMLETMPDKHREKLFRYKKSESEDITRKNYALKKYLTYLYNLKPKYNNTEEFGQAHLNSLKQNVNYYSCLLKECINDIKKGQLRNGVAAVHFCHL